MTLRPDLTVAAVVERDGQFLLVEERVGHRMVFNQPAGHVERNEPFVDAVVRETLEETGYKVIGAMELFGLYHNTSPVTNRDHVAFFVATAFQHEFERKPDHEIAEVGWFDRHALPQGVSPATSQRIDEYFDRVEKRAVWGY